MAAGKKSIHGNWSSGWIFILAAAGSAIGLGNIWKFPYLAGTYGGGAFVLVYLLCVAAIGLPIMISEIMLGRRGRQSPINTMRALARQEKLSRHWALLGWVGVVAGFLILSYYSVIGGWTLAYVFESARGSFVNASADAVSGVFGDLLKSPQRLMLWHTVFMAMTMFVVARGVKSGIEQAVKYMMPALFLILILLVGYAMNSGHFGEGLRFMFQPDFSKLTGEAVLAAMGQAFFSLSLGMGAIMVYGSYLPEKSSIGRSSVFVVGTDTLIAILAGVAIFPIIFANSLDPTAAGPGLAFVSLPLAFGHMPAGIVFGTLFFVLLLFAAWTSAVSLVEPAVSYLVENHRLKRLAASLWVGGGIWLLGLGSVLSFNLWADKKIFGWKNFFDSIDFVTSNVMLPLGGLLIAVFAAWLMKRRSSEQELRLKPVVYDIWRFVTRFVAPIAVLVVLLNVTGLLKILTD